MDVQSQAEADGCPAGDPGAPQLNRRVGLAKRLAGETAGPEKQSCRREDYINQGMVDDRKEIVGSIL